MATDLGEVLKELQKENFYGTVELKYEHGRVVTWRTIETQRPKQPLTIRTSIIFDEST